jgi:hypothetical protein
VRAPQVESSYHLTKQPAVRDTRGGSRARSRWSKATDSVSKATDRYLPKELSARGLEKFHALDQRDLMSPVRGQCCSRGSKVGGRHICNLSIGPHCSWSELVGK